MSEFQKTFDQAFPDMFVHIAKIIVDSWPLPMEYLLTNDGCSSGRLLWLDTSPFLVVSWLTFLLTM